MILVIPSTIFCTSSTSLNPMRCLFEMSHLPPTAALCSPDDPRGCRSNPAQISSSLCTSLFSSGSTIITDARSPVPRFEGHVPRNPSFGSYIRDLPFASEAVLIESDSAQKRPNTPLMSPPSSIAMIRHWSSSLHQHSTVLASLWKIPRPSGQSRPAPAAPRSCMGPGFWKRKPPACRADSCSAVSPPSGKYVPCRSSGSASNACLSTPSTASLSSLLLPAGREKPEMLRAARTRVDLTYFWNRAACSSLIVTLVGSRSLLCSCVLGSNLCHPSTIG
mmetsp:Transcript_34637/g.84307  ORF Transcript_34637/g.84307 Transcript_34637/m.84307 type:complete len:277 (-) Transcript_34637:648-1478(-)